MRAAPPHGRMGIQQGLRVGMQRLLEDTIDWGTLNNP